MNVLIPCPFCGDSMVMTERDQWVHPWRDDCPADAIRISSKDEPAVAMWNARPSDTLIEEQAARIADLEKELAHSDSLFRALQSSTTDDIKALSASQARLSEAVKVLEKTTTVLDALLKESPGTLSCGRRCQLETTQEDEEDYMIAYGHAEFFLSQAKAFIATLGEEK